MMEKPAIWVLADSWNQHPVSPATLHPQFSALPSQPFTHGCERYLALRNHHPGDPYPSPYAAEQFSNTFWQFICMSMLQPMTTVQPWNACPHQHAPHGSQCWSSYGLQPVRQPVVCEQWHGHPGRPGVPSGLRAQFFSRLLCSLPPSPTWSRHPPPRGSRCTKELPQPETLEQPAGCPSPPPGLVDARVASVDVNQSLCL